MWTGTETDQQLLDFPPVAQNRPAFRVIHVPVITISGQISNKRHPYCGFAHECDFTCTSPLKLESQCSGGGGVL